MKKLKFAFAIHNHQPIGNFEHVFESAYTHSYLPFLEILERHPHFKISLHFSGILLEWISDHHPETLDKIRSLVNRNQVEMMTGGYYEPILPAIPDCDKIGQIQKLSQFIKEEFDIDPVGMWLAERVWEPHLPKPIAEAGVKYTIVDDSHFKYSGLTEEELLGYFVTEELGHSLNLFSSSKFLRYSIPFKEPKETIKYFRKIASEDGNNLIVYGDDGEKFGVWPQTYKHCYEERWIERFFGEIEKNRDWIEMIHLKDALEILPPKGRVYLPTASYHEMNQWSLPPQAFREYEEFEHILKNQNLYERFGIFVGGGLWRNFLAKYPEANNMHKKMLLVSAKIKEMVRQAHHVIKASHKEKIKKAKELVLSQAKDELWKGQCNCPYWHGVFGGLYLPHLRSAIYKHLIQAEKTVDELAPHHTVPGLAHPTGSTGSLQAKNWMDHQVLDFDKDGQNELLIHTPIFGLYFSLASGGSLFELDFKPKSVNLLDTLTRREEGYHKKLWELKEKSESQEGDQVASIHDLILTKEEGLEKYLTYDWYRRGSLIDHFLGEHTKLEDFSRCEYPEQGDFVNQPYLHKIEKAKGGLTITLYRDGYVWIDEKRAPITVAKRILLRTDSSELDISYLIINNYTQRVSLWFGVEFNFAMFSGDDQKRFYYVKGHEIESKKLVSVGNAGVSSDFGITDQHSKLDINFKLDQPCQIWRFPIYTVSLSEEGFEKVYQSSVLFPNWKLSLDPQKTWEVKILNKIADL
jgi:alpha-amylase